MRSLMPSLLFQMAAELMDFERNDREGSNSGDSSCSGGAVSKGQERAASKEKEEGSSRGRSSEVREYTT